MKELTVSVSDECIGEVIFREEIYTKEENKKLKSDLAFERTMLDNVRAEYKSLQNVIKNLKEEIKEIEKNQDYRHHRAMVAERGGEDED